MRSTEPSGYWRLSTSAIAITSLMVTLASLATLVTVVSVKDVDTLSTVALVLAVLAFVVQLIVFVVQSAAANEQLRSAQELHAAMMSTLAQIQERTQGTQQSVDRMNTRLLDAAIGKATAEGFQAGTPEYDEVVARTISDGSSERLSLPVPPTRGGGNYPPALPADEAEAVHREMRTWPAAQDFPDVLKVVKDLGAAEQEDLLRFATDAMQFSGPSTSIGPGAGGDPDSKLAKSGLIKKIPGWKLYTLTPEGRRIGRFLSATEPPPPNTPEELVDLQRRIAQRAEEKSLRMTDNRDLDD
jgi:hypothetical protein